MLLFIQKEQFKTALSQTKKALPKIVIQEERAHILCVYRESELIMSATNGDLKARHVVEVTSDETAEVSFTMDPKIVEKLLSKIDHDRILIEYSDSDKTVKIYTSEDKGSFTTLQSFSQDKMLTVPALGDVSVKHAVPKKVFLFSLKYAQNYLAPPKDDQKQYDFVIIHEGKVYAANGLNKMGFIVFKSFVDFENVCIRKSAVPLLISYAEDSDDSDITFIETAKDIGITNSDGKHFFTFLKSNIEPPTMRTEYTRSEGPYTRVDKKKMLKVLERLFVSNKSTSTMGVEITLNGEGQTACIDMSPLTSLKSCEKFNCVRVDDPSSESVEHVIDYRILKSILSSFETDREVRLHINEDTKFFKVYNGGEVDGNKYILAGIGSYSKVIRQ